MNRVSVAAYIHLDDVKDVNIKVRSNTDVKGMKYMSLELGDDALYVYMTPQQAEQIAKALLSELQVLTKPEHAE